MSSAVKLLFSLYRLNRIINIHFICVIYFTSLIRALDKSWKFALINMGMLALLKSKTSLLQSTIQLTLIFSFYMLQKASYPLYHSEYETFYAVETFLDPNFKVSIWCLKQNWFIELIAYFFYKQVALLKLTVW